MVILEISVLKNRRHSHRTTRATPWTFVPQNAQRFAAMAKILIISLLKNLDNLHCDLGNKKGGLLRAKPKWLRCDAITISWLPMALVHSVRSQGHGLKSAK
jgi:hypothetical protein